MTENANVGRVTRLYINTDPLNSESEPALFAMRDKTLTPVADFPDITDDDDDGWQRSLPVPTRRGFTFAGTFTAGRSDAARVLGQLILENGVTQIIARVDDPVHGRSISGLWNARAGAFNYPTEDAATVDLELASSGEMTVEPLETA
jgi:hypothetical protein